MSGDPGTPPAHAPVAAAAAVLAHPYRRIAGAVPYEGMHTKTGRIRAVFGSDSVAREVAGPRPEGDNMELQPSRPSAKGPADWFTGDVWIDTISRGEEPSRVRVSAVHFTPGARTAWHSHALGQTLCVTEGQGIVQSRGEDIVTIRSGDIVHTAPEEWHWHGAAPDHVMTHLSITEGVPDEQGPEMEWGEHVTDEQYSGRRQ